MFDFLLLKLSFLIKGVTGNVWELNGECSIVEKLFRIHLRYIKRFNDV